LYVHPSFQVPPPCHHLHLQHFSYFSITHPILTKFYLTFQQQM
jgi:hypothetical protein